MNIDYSWYLLVFTDTVLVSLQIARLAAPSVREMEPVPSVPLDILRLRKGRVKVS